MAIVRTAVRMAQMAPTMTSKTLKIVRAIGLNAESVG